MCSIKIQTENSRKNTNAPPALPMPWAMGNASALRASKGVHNKIIIITLLMVLSLLISLTLLRSVVNKYNFAHFQFSFQRWHLCQWDTIHFLCLHVTGWLGGTLTPMVGTLGQELAVSLSGGHKLAMLCSYMHYWVFQRNPILHICHALLTPRPRRSCKHKQKHRFFHDAHLGHLELFATLRPFETIKDNFFMEVLIPI